MAVKRGREPGEHEGDHDGRAGVLRGRGPGRDEDARADDAGDPQRRQAEGCPSRPGPAAPGPSSPGPESSRGGRRASSDMLDRYAPSRETTDMDAMDHGASISARLHRRQERAHRLAKLRSSPIAGFAPYPVTVTTATTRSGRSATSSTRWSPAPRRRDRARGRAGHAHAPPRPARVRRPAGPDGHVQLFVSTRTWATRASRTSTELDRGDWVGRRRHRDARPSKGELSVRVTECAAARQVAARRCPTSTRA